MNGLKYFTPKMLRKFTRHKNINEKDMLRKCDHDRNDEIIVRFTSTEID